jgi:hypothetical protein
MKGAIEYEDVKHAVEQLHNCKASNSEEKQCCAWASPIEGSKKFRYYAVLSIPPIDSPQKAVRASIVQDHRTGKLK